MPSKKTLKIIVVILIAAFIISILLAVILASLNTARQKSPYFNPTSGGFQNPSSQVFDGINFLSEGRSSAPSGTSQQSAQNIEGLLTQQKIVKNGSFSLLVGDVENVADNIKAVATRLGGFVANYTVGGLNHSPIKSTPVSSKEKYGSVTIRVPASSFDEAMDEIRKLAVEVQKENITANDVTEQFIDLEARLRNLKAEESQYLDIMKRAYSIVDTLSVAQRLADVRGRIEQLEGQLKYISNQVEMSSINIMLAAEASAEIFGFRWRPLVVIKQAFRDGLSALMNYADWMIWLMFRVPVILLWFATVFFISYVARRIYYWIKKKYFTVSASL